MRILPLLCLSLLSGLGSSTLSAEPTSRPNIIFILTDDLGYGDIGAFFQNQRASRNLPAEMTPAIDKMATEGIQLRGHYCPAPVCAPSRASFLSGVHQGTASIRNNQFDKALDDNHTVATVLRQAGYATAAIGKWGLQGSATGGELGDEHSEAEQAKGSPATWPAYPTKRGFDYFFGYVRHADGHEHYPFEGVYRGKKQVWDGDHEVSAGLAGCYTTDLFTARAKKWIVDQRAAPSGKPFFLYLAFDTPHATTELATGPYPAGGGLKGGLQWTGKSGSMINTAGGKPDSYYDPAFANATYAGPPAKGKKGGSVETQPWPDVYKRYASSVRRIDQCVGDLLQLLKDLKIDDKTMVVFTTDNGPSQESYLKQQFQPNFFHSFGPFDGIKRDCLEGGVRVGAIARFPGIIPPKQASDSPSQFHDWMPTFAAVGGIPAPARTDGVSLLPTLTGKGEQKPSTIYTEYQVEGRTPDFGEFSPAHRGRVRGQMQMIRLGDLVGVRYDVKNHADPFEIYDVMKDPKQVSNLAAANPAMQQRMKDAVLQLRRPNPTAKRPYDGELVPSVFVEKPRPGVSWRAYNSPIPWVPKFDEMPPALSGEAARPEVGTMTGDANGMLWSGFIEVPADGAYEFSLNADTGALLRIHGALLIDADSGYKSGEPRKATIQLKAGKHPFRLYYTHRSETKLLDLEWSGPGIGQQPVPATAFTH